MKKHNLYACLVALSITVFGSFQVMAEHHESFDLKEITCWDVGVLEEQEAAFAMVLLYGYAAGDAGQSSHTGQGLESTLVKAGGACEAEPDMLALDAIQSALK